MLHRHSSHPRHYKRADLPLEEGSRLARGLRCESQEEERARQLAEATEAWEMAARRQAASRERAPLWLPSCLAAGTQGDPVGSLPLPSLAKCSCQPSLAVSTFPVYRSRERLGGIPAF